MVWNWSFVGNFFGPDALRTASRAEKVLYLGYAMSATGILTAIVWQALLVDRRDALVLGTMPVTGRAIIRAKLQALVAYVLIVAVAMHGVSALMFGAALAEGRDLLFAIRGVLAHLVASVLASGWVVIAVTALQGTMLALLGPRGFRRLSPLLQLGLVAASPQRPRSTKMSLRKILRVRCGSAPSREATRITASDRGSLTPSRQGRHGGRGDAQNAASNRHVAVGQSPTLGLGRAPRWGETRG